MPVFHHFCLDETLMDWHAPLAWPDTATGSISIRLKGPSDRLNILVCPADRAWRRSYLFFRFDWSSRTGIPLGETPGLGARLKYLRLDGDVLEGFLRCEATFSALRRVRVDVAAPGALFKVPIPSWCRAVTGEDWSVRCPALGVLSLAAVHEPHAGNVTLQQSDVVMLVSALRLSSKPALELCAVIVDVPDGQMHALTLHDVFSSVSSVSAVLRDVFDSAVWDDSDALAEEKYNSQSLAR